MNEPRTGVARTPRIIPATVQSASKIGGGALAVLQIKLHYAKILMTFAN